MRNRERAQRFARALHRLPIRLAAHDHADERRLVIHGRLFALGDESFLTVEGIEVLDFDEIEIRFTGAIEQRHDLRMGNRAIAHEARSPVIRAERLVKTVGINLRAAIADRKKFQSLAIELLELPAELLRIALFPIEENIYANQSFLLSVAGLRNVGGVLSRRF